MVDLVSQQASNSTGEKHYVEPLVVDRLSKAFGGLQVLCQISFSLKHGERRALIGPNGAGKTTLFNLIAGVLSPSSGKIWLFEKDVTRMAIHKRAAMGVARTFQITNLLPTLSMLENILLSLQANASCPLILHRPISSFGGLMLQAREILEAWGLWEKRDLEVRNLSYGERRELEIVVALARQPKLLLLDEPTSGLSPGETVTVTKMLRNLPREVTVLLIEHDMDVAFALAERISVLHMGKMVAEGSIEEIRGNSNVQQIYLGSQTV